MRVTNAMMTNTTLINISRNMRYLDKLIQQIESTKKIQRPSDDPIIANRSLKFRAIISETEQYKRNIQSGLSWMQVTEAPFSNIVEKLLKQIRERSVEASTGTETAQDKEAIVAELRELIDQIGLEMNQSYAGRYVFSGYRTNEPPIFTEDNTKSYAITQSFNVEDIEKTKSYQLGVSATDNPLVNDIYIAKLAYTNLTSPPTSVNGLNVVNVSSFSPSPNVKDYQPNPGTVNYIPETGELVFHENDVKAMSSNDFTVTYTKTNFTKGDLNPIVYFECTDLSVTPNVSYDMNNQNIQYEFAANTFVTINSLAKNVYTDKMYADLRNLCDFVSSLKTSDPKLLETTYRATNVGATDEEVAKYVEETMAKETAQLNAVIYDRFNNSLYLIDHHAENAMREQTRMGSRMQRLELLASRLDQDETTYTELLANNEETDMVKAIIQRSSAEAAYQASLKAAANIVQMTLANFIG